MRSISGPAAAAALALIAVGVAPATAAPAPSPAAPVAAYDVVDVVTDADGTTHTRMVATYRGLPVLGGDRVVHREPAGALRGVSRTLTAPLSLATKPLVGAVSAATTALAKAPATRTITGARQEGTRLVVDALSGTGRLAWEVVTGGTQADGTPSRLATYVDARTGEILRREQQIQTADGQGHSLYSGTVPLRLDQSGSTYELDDPTRGHTYTTDLKNKEDSLLCQVLSMGCQSGALFTSPDTSFGDGTTASRESAAVDAQYGTDMTWDFYRSTFGRHGIFGDGSGSFNRVHYGKDYVNAFWDGTKMTYGDGDGVDYGPLVSLDVAGHEMSHGVTEHTADLTYSGESGGLNEATSDIFGTMVEFFAANPHDPADYLIGEQFDLKQHAGLRRMDDPASDGSSLSCWTSGAGKVDVHYSSGIGNHFFYLLAEGSGAKTLNGVAYDSPTCDGSTVDGIGRDAAARIWYRALTVYMTSGTDYHGARTATLDAARDLYGAGSVQHSAVATAWSAVGVS